MLVANEERRSTHQVEPEESRRRAALGALINIAGRQRMLSHRAVMFLALSQLPGCADGGDPLRDAQAALEGFAAGVQVLLTGDPARGIPPLFSERVQALLAGPIEGYASGRQAIEAFDQRAASCLMLVASGEPQSAADTARLADLCGSVLLPLWNQIVGAFEADLAETLETEAAKTADIRAVMTGALDDIEQTGTRIRLIAFNALIEAARAGDAGKAFSVIAEEIKNLGAQTRQERARMQAAIDRLFAA